MSLFFILGSHIINLIKPRSRGRVELKQCHFGYRSCVVAQLLDRSLGHGPKKHRYGLASETNPFRDVYQIPCALSYIKLATGYQPYDSSGTGDDLPPSHQKRIPRGGRVAENGRPVGGSVPYPRMRKESLITELRKELRLSNEEQKELLSGVNADDAIRRIRNDWMIKQFFL
ncbi:unnamed protein product [Dovyalis caffra]|uniref:ENT domain-containing protein n=1 Tax=Dovyalis caffra TaxID=77055 RepID=A0AAV1RAA2_9ROSI|nr:unnamed protein product [Dovyalis caffra]